MICSHILSNIALCFRTTLFDIPLFDSASIVLAARCIQMVILLCINAKIDER